MRITVFGGGAWGRALAFAFAQNNEVSIVSRRDISKALVDANEALKKNNLPPIIQTQTKNALDSEYFVITITTSALKDWFKSTTIAKNAKVLIASKGIEEDTGDFVSDIAKKFIDENNLCSLAGPSFAKEVSLALPCALAIHSSNASVAQEFADLMPSFIKPYVKDDVRGGEIAGAYKNVIAIAGGICDGLVLGQNAKASLLSRGLVEMSRFGEFFGGKMQTFLGLSGAGDLFLSANSILSRNYRVGLGLAQNKTIDEILLELGEVAEGVKTAKAITQISQRNNIYSPIATEVQEIIKGKNPKESMNDLMKR
ncbi:glycerol-3-phosphate dehydrogenase [Helicobacter sp. 13S00482-2]|uniref:NAD(P)H-dependent glycerol-3-phosphate dehydrogenase n=1 Tax=Helicobacter sp. 13S00482-2 TaxID=1476200 RepID=UPI000BA64EFC|nr:NAD(P)H-dependent glycerol-3-phosphate dehydrogenase [Helicobacter sp. 13S00482-2]PAF54150.1 glycerol-3-phosphate dehydrogenase [Helicobacter sp. 13S00482-2]